jgi:hypothetical protein
MSSFRDPVRPASAICCRIAIGRKSVWTVGNFGVVLPPPPPPPPPLPPEVPPPMIAANSAGMFAEF